MKTLLKFPNEVIEQIGYYVYRLIDPRDGNTFYVGKGKGNRVFAHISQVESIDEERFEFDETDDKMRVIREIKNKGLDVIHVIHRHGMDEKIAREVEGALIDAYPGVLNLQTGTGNNDVGIMNVKELVEKYNADEVEFKHKCLIICVNRSSGNMDLLRATRFAWKVSKERARKAEVVLAVIRGIVRGVYLPIEWLPATQMNFPEYEHERPNRYGFKGEEATEDVRNVYIGKRIPNEMRKKGASYPIRYSY